MQLKKNLNSAQNAEINYKKAFIMHQPPVNQSLGQAILLFCIKQNCVRFHAISYIIKKETVKYSLLAPPTGVEPMTSP